MSFYTEIESIESFEKITKEIPICVVDFYAPWCGPCKKLAPELEKSATNDKNISDLKKDNKIQFLKINVDEHQELIEQLTNAKLIEITTIPLICFYKNGTILKEQISSSNVEPTMEIVNKLVKEYITSISST